MKKRKFLSLWIVWVVMLGGACTPLSPASESTAVSTGIVSSSSNEPTERAASTSIPETAEGIPVTGPSMRPAEVVKAPIKMIDDVESSGTGPQRRAPYGDSYKLNRFERPFLQDMTYVADLDIHKFGLSEDEDWYYISIQLIGNDPNNPLGIHYGAEIDRNGDGFGDYIIWTQPPYTPQWENRTIQVFQDSNLDTSGVSALKSDSASDANGYDTLVFDGSTQANVDPDLAWVRIQGNGKAMLQIAFKKDLTGPAFMLGVVADAGLKDLSKFDYADHFTEADAGSSVQSNKYYPLGLLYAVDNTCWEAYGMQTTGYEPKLCQPILQPVNTQSPDDEPVLACNPPPDCNGDEPGTGDFDPVNCTCR